MSQVILVRMAKLHELHFNLLLHPSYSPGLVSSDFYLFADLKKMLVRENFGWNEVMTETNAYFEVKDKSLLQKGVKKVREVLE